MADVLDILELERPATPEVTKESIMGLGAQKKVKTKPKAEVLKKPEGMARELFNLLVNDNKDVAPLFPTDTGKGYKQVKAQLGVRRVRPWKWMPFINPARKDGAVFHHWRRATDEVKEYPFAKFNKQVQVNSYNDQEYQQLLSTEGWTKSETDHLLELCRQFDLRFIIIYDRWDKNKYSNKTVEDMKERYYDICNILNKARQTSGAEVKCINYDADNEKRRKEQLKRLFERTTEQVEEEQNLLQELRKIEARKKDRERKTQDLQKLITAADGGAGTVGEQTPARGTPPDKKQPVRKKTAVSTPKAKVNEIVPTVETPTTGIKFPEFKTSGVFLRSQRMKLPPSVGQKKSKAIEQMLTELGLEVNPMPTDEICQHFNELRSDLVLLYELKLGLSTCEYELQALRHQYEALAPGKTLDIPTTLLSNNESRLGGEELQPVATMSRPKALSEIIDVIGPATTPTRKRKAALEQNNILKKIKNRM